MAEDFGLINRVPQKEPPVYYWSDWQSLGAVRAAISGLEQGVFDAAAQVVDAMGRDDRIVGCMSTRAGALPALPLTMDPRGDARRKKFVASTLEDSFSCICPDYALTALTHWGIQLGIGLGQLTWEYKDGLTMPRLRVWHPRFLTWRWEEDCLYVQTQEGQVKVEPGNGEWVVFSPYGIKRGWMFGKVRSLFVPWLIRQWGMRDYARYSEVHGMPIRKAVTPAGAEGDDKDRFLSEVANLGQENTVRTPRVPGGGTGDTDRYDIELVEAIGNSSAAFVDLIGMASTNISIAILGQNLTTEISKNGSRSAAQVHDSIRQDLLQADSENLGACIQEQIYRPFCQVNFGDAELAPLPMWKTKPAEDKVVKGEAMKTLGEGLLALKKVGAKPDIDKVMEADEIPITGPAEDVDVNALPQAPSAAPGVGGDVAPGTAKPKKQTAQAAQAEITSSDVTDDYVPDEAIEGQLYVDEIADSAVELGAAEIRPDLDTVMDIIKSAKDYDSLRQALMGAYSDMSRKQLAKLMKNAIQLGHMAGQFAVEEER